MRRYAKADEEAGSESTRFLLGQGLQLVANEIEPARRQQTAQIGDMIRDRDRIHDETIDRNEGRQRRKAINPSEANAPEGMVALAQFLIGCTRKEPATGLHPCGRLVRHYRPRPSNASARRHQLNLSISSFS